MNIYDVLRDLVDAAGYPTEAQLKEAKDAIQRAEQMSVFGSAALLADTNREAGQ